MALDISGQLAPTAQGQTTQNTGLPSGWTLRPDYGSPSLFPRYNDAQGNEVGRADQNGQFFDLSGNPVAGTPQTSLPTGTPDPQLGGVSPLQQAQQSSQPTALQVSPTPLATGTPTSMINNPLSQYASNVTPTSNYTNAPNTGVTPGSPSSGSFAQGSVLPNVSTVSTAQTAAPSFYTDYLNKLAQQGQQAAQGSQFAGATDLQNQAFQDVSQNVGNYQPTLNSAIKLAQSVGGSNLAQAIGDLGQSNIANYLAPQATAGLVGSGQFGSSRGAQALGSTIANAELGITQQQQQALQQDQANKLAAAGQLGSLAGQQQTLGLGDVNALSTLGGQQQTINQNQQLFPMQQLTNESALLRGYTIPTSVATTTTGPGQQGQFGLSPLQQISTLAALGAGVSNTNLGSQLFGTAAGVDKNGNPIAATPGALGNLSSYISGLFKSNPSSGNTQTPVSDSNLPSGVPSGSVLNSDGTYTAPNGEQYTSGGQIYVPPDLPVGSTQPSVDYGATSGTDTSTT